VGQQKRDTAEIRERFLTMCAGGRPWLHWLYWMFGGRVRAQHPDHAKEPTLELLSELLRSGDIVAGAPQGWFGFEAWDLSLEESIERIREGWDALERPPNHGDLAAFTMPEEWLARYRQEHPKSAEEIERIHRSANSCLKGQYLELEDLPEVVEEWDQDPPDVQESFQYMWHSEMIDNDLIALESYHRGNYLTPEQEQRYEQLKDDLRTERPTLERLGIDLPAEVLEA
jgi:hypothetical protein